MASVADALRDARGRLASHGDSPGLDAEWLLAHVLDWPRARLRSHDDTELSPEQAATLEGLLQRRLTGEPIAYLTGWHGFRDLILKVGPGVLIPRPETEELVDLALEQLGEQRDIRVLDIGTGSGAIALAIAHERPQWRVDATEIDRDALAIARANITRLDLGQRVRLHEGPWLAEQTGPWELVVSNPPYIPENDPHLERGDVAFEPRLALASGTDGLDALRSLCRRVPPRLSPGGWLMVEHGFDQAEAVARLFHAGGLEEVHSRSDLAGRLRFTLGRRPGSRGRDGA